MIGCEAKQHENEGEGVPPEEALRPLTEEWLEAEDELLKRQGDGSSEDHECSPALLDDVQPEEVAVEVDEAVSPKQSRVLGAAIGPSAYRAQRAVPHDRWQLGDRGVCTWDDGLDGVRGRVRRGEEG